MATTPAAAAAAVAPTTRIYICHYKSETNDEEVHTILHIAPTPSELLLLRVHKQGPGEWFNPIFDRGANAPYALASYFTHKYPCDWKKGDPLDSEVESESDEEVAQFKLDRAKKRAKEYDYVIKTGVIEPCEDLHYEILGEYLDRIQEAAVAERPKESWGIECQRAYEYLKFEHLDDKVRALSIEDFFPPPTEEERKKDEKAAAERRKRRLAELTEIDRLKAQLEERDAKIASLEARLKKHKAK